MGLSGTVSPLSSTPFVAGDRRIHVPIACMSIAIPFIVVFEVLLVGWVDPVLWKKNLSGEKSPFCPPHKIVCQWPGPVHMYT